MTDERSEPLVLAKFFKEARFADAFMRGELFAPRLPFYRGIDEENTLRGDIYEATQLIYPASMNVSTTELDPRTGKPLMSMDIDPKDIAGPVRMGQPMFDRFNLFCMAEIFLTEKKLLEIVDGKASPVFRFDKRLSRFGRHVVIVNASKFFERVRNACEKRGYILYPSAIEYYDPRQGSRGSVLDLSLVFLKRLQYEYQSEYRLVIDTGLHGRDPITLDIGDIGDISIRYETDNINLAFGLRIDAHPVAE